MSQPNDYVPWVAKDLTGLLHNSPIDPKWLAKVTNGTWQSLPRSEVRWIVDRIENVDLTSAIVVPEMFAENWHQARAARARCTKALRRGAAAGLVSRIPPNCFPDAPLLVVDDVKTAVRKFSDARRARSEARFIAVTGSTGKTSTKSLIAQALKPFGPVSSSFGNYNLNDMVRLPLANHDPASKFGVYELAIPNMRSVAGLIRPRVAVFVSLCPAHVSQQAGFVDGPEEILKVLAEKKGWIFESLGESGVAVLNRDDPNFELMQAQTDVHCVKNVMTFGRHSDSTIRIVDFQTDPNGSQVCLEVNQAIVNYRINMPGEHFVWNSAAAIGAVHALGLDLQEAANSLSQLEPIEHRGNQEHFTIRGKQFSVVDHALSCTVDSMRSAIDSFVASTPEQNWRGAVIGDMGFLGAISKVEHEKLGKFLESKEIARIFTIGPEMEIVNNEFTDRARIAAHAFSVEEVIDRVVQEIPAGGVLLLKSARRIGLNRFCKRLREMQTEETGVNLIHHSAASSESKVLRISFAGDTYLGEFYQEKRAKKGETNYLKAHGYDYSFARISEHLNRSNAVIVNLECALTDQAKSPLQGKKGYVLKGDPTNTLATLKSNNVVAASLANNHAMDFGAPGLYQTIAEIKKSGITPFGAGENMEDAQKPFLLTLGPSERQFRLAVLSGYSYFEHYDKAYHFYAARQKAGVNNLNINRLKNQVKELKREGYFTIVFPHWGSNYSPRSLRQFEFARRLTNEVRADLILGHGPHVMNQLDKRRSQWIAYSLGNLVFNSEGEYAASRMRPYSLIADLVVEMGEFGYEVFLELYPIVSNNLETKFQPRFVSEFELQEIFQALRYQHFDRNFHQKHFRRCQSGNACGWRIGVT